VRYIDFFVCGPEMAEKLTQRLGGDPEPRKLNVGKSFEKKKGGLYGLRYDFKPVSLDEEKDGLLEVKENNSVAVSLPHIDGSGVTNYKGHILNSSAKECVLIIDHETGELTIERLSHQILCKKTRAEKTDKQETDKHTAKSDLDMSNPYEVKKVPDHNPYEVKKVPDHNPYEVKKVPDHNPYEVKKVPDSNPYAVKKVPDKPSVPRELEGKPHHRSRKQSHSKDVDSDFVITPMNSAKSSPVRQGSAKQSPSSQQVDPLGRPLDALGRPMESDSSDSSSDSDSDSDFDEVSKGQQSNAASSGSMPSFMTQDFTSGQPFPQRSGSGGVLPTARPESHKSRKYQGVEATKSRTKPMASSAPSSKEFSKLNITENVIGSNYKTEIHANNSMSNLLGDDLRLSDSDNSD